MKIRPTPKQKKLATLLLENIRKPKPDPVGKVMLEAGYSQGMSIQPSKVLNSLGFQTLLDKWGSEEWILENLRDVGEQTDNQMARVKALQEFVRMRGLYAPPKMPVDPLANLTEDEIDEQIRQLEQQKIKRISSHSVVEGELQDATPSKQE